jgi:2'-hydroxyisoflavone reductase
MSSSRRRFLKLSSAAGGALALGAIGSGPNIFGQAKDGGATTRQNPAGPPPAPLATQVKPLKILILGGTGFTGPHQVKYALSRGHKVTVFNRGKSHPGELPKEAEQLIGDRNTGQLDALKGRKWDVCIDIPTSIPVWVRDAAQILQGNVDRYAFVSTVSVYGDISKPGIDESAPVAQYTGPDAMKETQATLMASPDLALYGPLKALSEKEAEKWFPGKTLVVRPGLIVGPGDPSDRFTYWPLRIERGGEVMAPGDPHDPVQLIDARDLAEWIIRLVEQGTVGTFNGVGPRARLSVAEMLYGIKGATTSDAQFTWVDTPFLTAQKVSPSNAKAVAAGLTYRSLADITRATLDWYHSQPAPRQSAKLRAGIASDREVEVLAAWHAQKKS